MSSLSGSAPMVESRPTSLNELLVGGDVAAVMHSMQREGGLKPVRKGCCCECASLPIWFWSARPEVRRLRQGRPG